MSRFLLWCFCFSFTNCRISLVPRPCLVTFAPDVAVVTVTHLSKIPDVHKWENGEVFRNWLIILHLKHWNRYLSNKTVRKSKQENMWIALKYNFPQGDTHKKFYKRRYFGGGRWFGYGCLHLEPQVQMFVNSIVSTYFPHRLLCFSVPHLLLLSTVIICSSLWHNFVFGVHR